MDHFRDGKIAESRIIMDVMGLMQQLVPRLPTFAAFARSVGDGVLAEG
jgi:hypothetical protein